MQRHRQSNDDHNYSNDSLNDINVQVNNYWLFNVSLFVEVIFQSISIIIIVIINNLINTKIDNFINFYTIWTLISCLLVIINGLWNIISSFKHKGTLSETLGNQIFGASKSHNVQYGLITSDVDDSACVVLGDVVQY